MHFYFYAYNKWRAFYKQLNNEHSTCSNINKEVNREIIYTNNTKHIEQKETYEAIYIYNLDTQFRTELCYLQNIPGLNNTCVRVCMVCTSMCGVCVFISVCVFICVCVPVCRACVRVRAFVYVGVIWSYVLSSTLGNICLLASILYEQFDSQ